MALTKGNVTKRTDAHLFIIVESDKAFKQLSFPSLRSMKLRESVQKKTLKKEYHPSLPLG